MKVFFRSVSIVAFCFLSAGMIWASGTGEIRGRVLDEQGAPLPTVTITAKSPGMQGVRTTVTDENGFFKLPLLPVGIYSLTYELEGFSTLTQTDTQVRLGFTMRLEAVLKLATLEETITVTSEAPLLDVTKVDTSTRLNADELNRVPTQGRSIQEVLSYVPGVTGVRADTLTGYGTGLPSFRGEGEEGNNWLVDGLSIRGSRYNDSGITTNYDAWEEVQVVSDGFSPDWGQALGGTVNIVTKSGGNEFHGEIGALIRNWNLRADRKSQLSLATEPNTSFNQFFGNLGGPIIKDKLWFFISNNFFSRSDASDTQSIGWLTFPEGKSRVNTNNFFGKITFTPHVKHTFSLSGVWDSFVSQSGGTGLPETYTKTDYSDYAFRLNYRGILDDDTFIVAAFGQSDRDSRFMPLDEDFGPARYYWIDIGQFTNNAEWDRAIQDKRTDFTARLTRYLDLGSLGHHELGAGFSFMRTYSGEDGRWTGKDMDLWQGNGFDNGTKVNWAEPGIPTLLTEYGVYGFNNTTRGISLYLMDRFTIGNFSIMLGLRTDTQKIYDDLDQEIWSWGLGDFLSPRFSIAWDILGDGKNILKFGYGKFCNTITTTVLQFFNSYGGFNYRQYDWIGGENPTDAQLKNPANWEFSFEQSAATTPYEVDSELKPNDIKKFLLEFDRRLGTDWVVKLRGIYSYSHDLTELIGVFDEETIWRFYLTNFELKKRDYRAIELELNGRVSDKFMLHASYTWSEAKGTNPGQFEFPTWASKVGNAYEAGVFGDHVNAPEGHPYKDLLDWIFGGLGGRGVGDAGWYGFLPYSVDHQVKALGTYFAPYGIMVSAGIEWLSGYHWEKKGYSEGYGDFYLFPEGRGGRTTPGHLFIDMSIEKNFFLPQGMGLGLRLNFFNILNSQRPISFVKEDTDLFGEVWGRQMPRWLQLQFSFKF
jgi:hypothetical protein